MLTILKPYNCGDDFHIQETRGIIFTDDVFSYMDECDLTIKGKVCEGLVVSTADAQYYVCMDRESFDIKMRGLENNMVLDLTAYLTLYVDRSSNLAASELSDFVGLCEKNNFIKLSSVF